ncbi:response regulator [Fluviispira multicolorata]|uniref:Sensory/regulatory protein RpfC n=1 Tax=Fluviispira multicolorata TaxID=2654512 RepID=A0A833N494_9BACT|nr:response regulator [Fluviispira multicolorata]KAB8031791.1 response regulator [Fluviispira multicolorata]
MIDSESRFWKIPYYLISKRILAVIAIISIYILTIREDIISNSFILFYDILNAWIITITYFLFKLVHQSGRKNYLIYSKIVALLAFFSWMSVFLSLSETPIFGKLNIIAEEIPFIIIFIIIIINKRKFNIKIERLEPWMTAILYLTVPLIILINFQIFYKSNSVDLVESFLKLYIYSIAFLHSYTAFRFEYSRFESLKDEMEIKSVDISKVAESMKEATRLKGEFLANMSHELRTPLNGILGSATLLVGTKLNQEQRGYLEILRACGNNLLVIINEILDFSKLEANKLELEHIAFEVNSCVENVFELLAPAAASQDTELIYDIDTNVPIQVVGDLTRIQQVLTHLTDNAIKFTKNGYTYISVHSTTNDSGKIKLSFDVEDTGSGISKKNITKIFQTFSQIDDSSTRKYGGTGLGLSIAKRLTEMMQGIIHVKSEIDKGSTFSFNVITENINTEKYKFEPSPCNLMNSTELSQKVIYILEKKKLLQKSIRNRCEYWGLEAFSAESIEEAIEIPSQISPSFVLVSIDDFDKVKVIEKITEKYSDKNIIFIAVFKNSSMYSPEDKIIPSGYFGNIFKPIRYSLLYEILLDASTQKSSGSHILQKVEEQKIGDLYPLKILIAEDNVVNQKLISNMLKKYGYICDIVANGNEVLEALTRAQYDIIFMDVQMPEMDGLEATRQIIKKYPKSNTRPKVLAMTAHARGAEGQVCLDAGMEGYLGKPIDMKELKQMLTYWGNMIKKMKPST